MTPAAPSQQTLETYIDALIREAHPDVTFPPEELASMKKQLHERVLKAINIGLLNALPDEYVQQAKDLLARNASEDDYKKLFQEAIPDQVPIVTQTLLDFRNVYLQG